MEFISVWDEAGRDLEAENAERSYHQASLASAGVWSFLAAAKSKTEFETRLALAETNISTIAAETGTSAEDIEAIMRRRYALLVEASDNPFAKDDDDDDDSDGDDSDSDSDDSDDDGDDDSDSDSDDSDDSDSDDSDSDSDDDDSDDEDDSDDGTGNPFAKDSSLKAEGVSVPNPSNKWLIQQSKNSGSYKTVRSHDTAGKALYGYHSLNAFDGYNKRLVHPDGTVMHRHQDGFDTYQHPRLATEVEHDSDRPAPGSSAVAWYTEQPKEASRKTASDDDDDEEEGGGHCEDCGAWLDEKGLCPSCLPNSERNEDERADGEAYWGAKRSETGRQGSLRHEALLNQILAGVDPLSPEFGVVPPFVREAAEGHTANGACPSCGSDEDIVGIPNAGVPNTVKWACQGCGFEGKVEEFKDAKTQRAFAVLASGAAGTYAGPSPTGGFHHWMSVDGGGDGHDSEDQCISCGVVAPDVADKDSAFMDHGALPLGCPGPKGAYNAHHFTHTGDGELECGFCGHQVKNDTKPSDVDWECRDDNHAPIPEDHPNYRESSKKTAETTREDRNNPEHPDYNDFDKNTWHEDNFARPKSYESGGVTVHEFPSTATAYNESQTNDSIKDGDVLSVPSENVHGYLHQAWPIATHHDGDPGEFHTPKADENGDTSESLKAMMSENPKYRAAHSVASFLHANTKRSSKTAGYSDEDLAKIRGENTTPISEVEARKMLDAPSGSRPRIYGLHPDGQQILRLNSNHYLDKYQPTHLWVNHNDGVPIKQAKTAGGLDFAPTTNTGNIPQVPTGYQSGDNQSTTKPRQLPSSGGGVPVRPTSGPGSFSGPDGPGGPGDDLEGPGSPSDDGMDFNPTSNGGDVKQGMGDYPSAKTSSVVAQWQAEHGLTDEQAKKVADLVAESAGSGLNFQERPVADGPLTKKVVEVADKAGEAIEMAVTKGKGAGGAAKGLGGGAKDLAAKGLPNVDTKGLMGTGSIQDFPLLLG